MKLLAFDTSTSQLSVALACGEEPVRAYEGEGGAQASAMLLPTVLSLLGDARLALARLDAIAFGRGPGSFTGLRTACSVAQGLAFGAGVPVLPVDTLLAVAEDARMREGVTRVVAVLDARMDEVYAAAYEYEDGQREAAAREGGAGARALPAWRCVDPPRLCSPEAVTVPAGWALAGNAAAVYAGRLPQGVRVVEALPRAVAMLSLAPALLAAGHATGADGALPLYLRDKVAQTTQERAALAAAKSAAAVASFAP